MEMAMEKRKRWRVCDYSRARFGRVRNVHGSYGGRLDRRG